MKVLLLAGEENSVMDVSGDLLFNQVWEALHLDKGICGVVGPINSKQIEGVALLRIGYLWYSREQMIEEKAITVHPAFRSAKGGRAKMLCEFTKYCADRLHLTLAIGVLSSHRTAAKVALYRRQFGEPSGAFWLYGTRTGGHKVIM